ncbi:unnamed protein product [Acanthoscelides obtectus]|uniref:Uncharacterized protein n=1 Tax=Acanthoscelides obtectus TaxID=200917 RepID=A0A9P0P2E3_ACAOB|nr:unnamed protein product [Acanthoscelides obtectus]CAK1676773.1 Protein yellow [Acanthoscelides obtectus]
MRIGLLSIGLIVFSLKQHHSWKIRHSATMHADKTASAFRVNSVTVSAPINVAGIALGPRVRQQKEGVVVSEERELYYCPMSSLHVYSIGTTVLRNEMNGFKGGEYQGEVKDHGIKSSQTAGMTMDNQGTLYYTLLATNSIAKWDTRQPFLSGQKIIAKDEKYLEWPNSFAFDQSGNITVLVNRLNEFIYGKLNLEQVNFRLITARVDRKSYLYDEVYDYSPEMNLTTTTLAANTEKLPEPQVLPGSDQDPNLAPHFEPTKDHQTTTAMPTTMDHSDNDHQMQSDQGEMNHDQTHEDHKDHGHTDHDQMDREHAGASQSQSTTSTTEKPSSGSARQMSLFLSVIFAASLLAV